jgi:hypothetical protein
MDPRVFVLKNVFNAIVLVSCIEALSSSVLCQSGPKPCAPMRPKNRQEVLKMEGTSDKNGCWVRDAKGNLNFVSNASPQSNYKPLIPTTQEDPGRPKVDPTAGVIGHGELAGQWRVHVDYFWVDNGEPDIQCRTYPLREYSYWAEEGSIIVGWDHIPRWMCTGCRYYAFAALDPNEPYADYPQVAHLSESGPGTYIGEGSMFDDGDYRIFQNDPRTGENVPQKLHRTMVKDRFKIVVTGNTLIGFFTISEDQSPYNRHSDVMCSEEVYRGERILPTKP